MSDIKDTMPNNDAKKEDKQKLPLSLIGDFCRKQAEILKPIVTKHKKLLIISGATLIILIGILMLLPGNPPRTEAVHPAQKSIKHVMAAKSTQAGDYISQRLQDISDQLATLRQQLTRSGAANIGDVSQQLNTLISQTRQLSSESNKIITDQIKTSTESLQKELVTINDELTKLQQAQKHIKFLKPSDLPFSVLAIDNIQQNNVVTISYNNTTFPIEIDSYVAGWKLIAADFVSQKAEFINAKEQHVVIDLNRMTGKN